LRQRKLVQWAVAYLAGAWLFLEFFAFVLERFGGPEILVRIAIVLLGIGFLTALVLAWYHGEKGRQRVSALELGMLAVLLILAAAAVANVRRAGRQAPATEAAPTEAAAEATELPPRSIAVLPLQNLSDRPEDRFFTDGMHEEILTQLSRIGALKVISRTSTVEYRDSPKNARVIGQELGARYLLEGGVLRVGDQVRMNFQLIDAQEDEHIWAESFDTALSVENLLAIQSQVARLVATTAEAEISTEEQARIERPPTGDLQAYEEYLRGRFFLNQRTGESMLEGLEHFRAATRLDPDYALVYAGIAESYSMLAAYGAMTAPEALPEARQAARQALDLDPDLAEAHNVVGWIHFWYDFDWPTAEAEFRRAIRLRPGYALVHHWYAWYLTAVGRWEEALPSFERARELDPLSLIMNSGAGWAYHLSGDSEHAVEVLQRTVELDDGFPRAHWWLGEAYLGLGKVPEAISHLERAVSLTDNHPQYVAPLAYALASTGQPERARGLLRTMEARAGAGPGFEYEFALVYTGLGETDNALSALESGLEARSTFMAFVKVDPRLSSLRSEARFQAVVDAMGFPD
jgi:TolB-like protein/Tfp pilus assembly protein PilF